MEKPLWRICGYDSDKLVLNETIEIELIEIQELLRRLVCKDLTWPEIIGATRGEYGFLEVRSSPPPKSALRGSQAFLCGENPHFVAVQIPRAEKPENVSQ